MRLKDTHYDTSETGCCARLDASLWEARELQWDNKLFLKDHMRAFLHIPLNFGSVISRDHTAIEEAQAYPLHPIWLTDEVSPWGSDIYVAVDRDIPSAKIERFSGTFMTRVFEGPYRDVGKWTREMEAHALSKGKHMKRVYYYYATCPKCAKHFGKNQVVLFAQVE